LSCSLLRVLARLFCLFGGLLCYHFSSQLVPHAKCPVVPSVLCLCACFDSPCFLCQVSSCTPTHLLPSPHRPKEKRNPQSLISGLKAASMDELTSASASASASVDSFAGSTEMDKRLERVRRERNTTMMRKVRWLVPLPRSVSFPLASLVNKDGQDGGQPATARVLGRRAGAGAQGAGRGPGQGAAGAVGHDDDPCQCGRGAWAGPGIGNRDGQEPDCTALPRGCTNGAVCS